MTRHRVATQRGSSMLEVMISASLLSGIFYMALSGYIGSMRGSAAGTAQLDAMVNSARALTAMNLELQEASVRDETVEIYPIDAATGDLIATPYDPATLPAPDTVFPPTDEVGTTSYALRFMTIGAFTTVGDTVTIEEAGPYFYRLGTGEADDFPLDTLVRVDTSDIEPTRVLCRNVEQVIFQRDSRGGAILITLLTRGRNQVTGETILTRQVVTVTPKNDFSANLSNYDLNGEQF